MLEIISKGFASAKAALSGRTALTAENIDAAVRQIRLALLEADVELGVVKGFIGRVKAQAVGEIVELSVKKAGKTLSVTPGDHFISICQRQLTQLMGPVEDQPIAFRKPLTTLMMVGLQGAGKTTTCGKLAKHLCGLKRRPLLVAADIYRPAAVQQLEILGKQLEVPVFSQPGVQPPALCQAALAEARRRRCDVVIFDTAGRLAVDEPLMQELADIKALVRPHNIFLVVDAMTGQDAVRTAQAFDQRLDLTGFIMTKFDGDARGGAALSIKEITGKPIKFLGMGEGLGKLERFRPAGLASRILGMGDLVGLMQDFEQVVDKREAERDSKRILKGKFTLDDFLSQLRTIKKMGSVKELMGKFPLPGAAAPPPGAVDEKSLGKMESMIQSMTPKERQSPELLDGSRQRRVARGSGRSPEDVKGLLERFGMMQKMLKTLQRQPELLNQLPGMPSLPGAKRRGAAAGVPPGFGPGLSGGAAPPGPSPKLKAKAKSKRQAEKKARKKARR
jgi:signal recognition particle subunit SRP54